MEIVSVGRSKGLSGVIASIPHGSSNITFDMKRKMRQDTILTNNDWFLNDLYSFLPRWLDEGIASYEAKDNNENWIRNTVRAGLENKWIEYISTNYSLV